MRQNKNEKIFNLPENEWCLISSKFIISCQQLLSDIVVVGSVAPFAHVTSVGVHLNSRTNQCISQTKPWKNNVYWFSQPNDDGRRLIQWQRIT